MAEWFKAAVLKTAVGSRPPWVRMPPRPPYALILLIYFLVFDRVHKMVHKAISGEHSCAALRAVL